MGCQCCCCCPLRRRGEERRGGRGYTSDVKPRCILEAPPVRNTIQHVLLDSDARRISTLFSAKNTVSVPELAASDGRSHDGAGELHTRDPRERGLLCARTGSAQLSSALTFIDRVPFTTHVLVLSADLEQIKEVCGGGADLDEVFIVRGDGVGQRVHCELRWALWFISVSQSVRQSGSQLAVLPRITRIGKKERKIPP